MEVKAVQERRAGNNQRTARNENSQNTEHGNDETFEKYGQYGAAYEQREQEQQNQRDQIKDACQQQTSSALRQRNIFFLDQVPNLQKFLLINQN